MEVKNTLAYSDLANIRAVKSFIVQAQGHIWQGGKKINLRNFGEKNHDEISQKYVGVNLLARP